MSKSAATPRKLTSVLILALVLAACSILYELLAAQTLSLLAANTVIWYSLVVGLFLASMGIGAFISGNAGHRSLWLALLRFELALTFLGAITVPLIQIGHTLYAQQAITGELATGLVFFYGTAIPIVIILGILTGAELPLLMRLARQVRDDSHAVNQTLGWDYLGALVGALLFPLVILPAFNLIAAGFLIASINLLVATWILLTRAGVRANPMESVLTTMLLACLVMATTSAGSIHRYFVERYYFFNHLEAGLTGWLQKDSELPEIIEERSRYQVIHLLKDPKPSLFANFLGAFSSKLDENPDFPMDYTLYLNGNGQTNTRYEEVYHEWFAHMPISMAGVIPSKVLVLGGGDGFLLRELLKYRDIDEIHHVDIDPVLIEFAKTNEVLRTVNEGALSNPRVATTITDGYQYIRQTPHTYDAIFIDFPEANTYDLAKLYSREFYEFVKRKINPGGFAVFDAPGNSMLTERVSGEEPGLLPQNTWPVFANTLLQCGFQTIIPFYSTLETDNPQVARMIKEQPFALSPAIKQEIHEKYRNPVKRFFELRKQQRILEQHLQGATSDYMLQGFTFMAPQPMSINKTLDLPAEVELTVLNHERYGLSFTDLLVVPEEVDRRRVNSIVRPTLPLSNWWQPMVNL